MSQQPVHMGRVNTHLTVVPIVGMAGGAEHAGCHRRGHFGIAPA